MRIFYTYFLISILLFIPKISFGILSDSLLLDMYKDIDKGIYDLQLRYTVGNKDITEEIKNRLISNNLEKEASCISGEFNFGEVASIANDNNSLGILNKKISKNCFGTDNSIPQTNIIKYKEIITSFYNDNTNRASNISQELYKIGRIGMYSDGVEENSPFDLMTDLADIDKIIFESDIPYNGVNSEDLDKVSDGLYAGLSPSVAFNQGKYKDNILFTGKYKTTDDNIPSYVEKEKVQNNTLKSDGSNQVCRVNNSGLDDSLVSNLIGNGNTNSQSGSNSGNSGSDNNSNGNSQNNPNGNGGSSSGGGYSPINDNDMWPCNDFFCIIIEFVTYKHNLLGGGKSLSIEGLLKKSNEHLKRFAGTSLIQANMTTNTFELGLKDLNLPDIFHLGFQVSHKPVPIINVNNNPSKEKETGSDEFKSKNLLEKYYTNLGLEYGRANDLKIFNNVIGEKKTIIDGAELNYMEVQNKFDALNQNIIKMRTQNDYISNTLINKKVLNDDMEQFHNDFIELNSFTNAIMEYTKNLGGLIKNMDKIPQK